MPMDAPPKEVRTDELPIVMSDGPTEGHEYRAIEEGECGNCGYDRIKVSAKHGERVETCMLCDYYRRSDSDEPQRPTTEKDELRKLRQYSDNDSSPVVKHGEFGPSSRFTHGSEVYGYDDGTSLLKVFRHHDGGTTTERKTFTRETLNGILRVLERDEDFVTEFVNDELAEKAVTNSFNAPNNPNAIHAGVVEHKGVRTALWIRINQMTESDDLAPIHYDPRNDGIVV